jgi:GT2 family glycosyltransferase
MKPILHGHLDSALIDNSDTISYLELRGWFLRESDSISSITFFYSDFPYEVLPVPRVDVANKIKSLKKDLNVGYEVRIPISRIVEEDSKITLSFKIKFLSGDSFDSYLTVSPKLKFSPKPLLNQHNNDYIELTKIKFTNFLSGTKKLNLPNHQAPIISVVIITHNQSNLVLNCLNSLAQELSAQSEVIIFDNASSDQTNLLFEKINGARVIRSEQNLHFLRAANLCCNEVKGKYILFINSDIEVLPGAISEAINKIESDSKCGIVGATLLSTDGTVQELGGLIFRDGLTTPLLLGSRIENISNELIEYVDYCSAAFMLISSKLFSELKGFKQDYEPAYYEDVDLCLRAKSLGYRICCSDKIQAIHIGRGSAVDPNEPNQLIKKNQQKFIALNEELLSKSALLDYKTFNSIEFTGGLLAFDDFLPISSNGQGLPRSSKIFEVLENKKIPINLILSHKNETNFLERFQKFSPVIISSEEELFRFLLKAKTLPSVWWISRPSNLEKVSRVLKKLPSIRSQIKIIYDSEAIYSTKLILQHEIKKNIALTDDEIVSIVTAEMKIVKNADVVIAVNQAEAKTFKEFNISNVHIISFGVNNSLPKELPDFHNTADLLFIGPSSTVDSPNADAALLTAKVIYPQFLKLINPSVVGLSFAGQLCDPIYKQILDPGISILGFVDRLSEITKQHRVLIVPHRFGSGIPIKVIEAAFAGIPIVCSELIAQQLNWQDGKEILIGRTADEIAVKAAALYGNIDLWRTLQTNAYEAVINQFSFEQFNNSIEELIERQKL